MKKKTQKMWLLLATFAFILLVISPLSAQSIVIIDDVSGIIVPHKEAKSLPAKIVADGSKITFKGNYILSGATTITITIVDPTTQTKMVETSGSIQNTTYLVQDVDISMLEENKWYNIKVTFNGNMPTTQKGQIKRVVNKAKSDIKLKN